MLFLVFGAWKRVGSEVWLLRQGGAGDRVGLLRKRKVVGVLRSGEAEAEAAGVVPSGPGDHSVASAGWGNVRVLDSRWLLVEM